MKQKIFAALVSIVLLGLPEFGVAENISFNSNSSQLIVPLKTEVFKPDSNSSLIYFSGKDDVSKRINSILFQGKFPPEPVPEDQAVDGSSIQSEVVRNDAKVIVVKFHLEGCGASCSSSNHYYNFDARTGQFIHYSSLFTPVGLSKMSLKMIKSWKKQIREDAKDAALSDVWAQGCIEDGVNGCLIGLLKECFQRMDTNYDKGTPYMGNDFEITGNGLTFTRESCINKYNFYTAGATFQDAAEYLSKYGKSLFSNGVITDQPMHPYNQILDGTIGEKYKIKMYLFEPYFAAGYIEGWYVYTKHNKPIGIFAEYKDNTLTIQEKNEEGKFSGAKIIANPTKEGFVGYWEGDGKKLKFSTVIGQP
jgi:hypothetical protein